MCRPKGRLYGKPIFRTQHYVHEKTYCYGKMTGRRRKFKLLKLLMEPYAILVTRYVVRSDGIQPAANRAARMAPEAQKSMHLQRLEDSNVRRLWRLINTFGNVRQGALEKKDVK